MGYAREDFDAAMRLYNELKTQVITGDMRFKMP
jgi:hypothetical protein